MGYSGSLVAVSLVRLRNDSTVAEAVFNYFTACLMINLVNFYECLVLHIETKLTVHHFELSA